MSTREAAGGGRFVDVAPERLQRWLDNFALRHGAITWTSPSRAVAADGAVAEVEVTFGPLTGDLVAHCTAVRRIGLVLVRLGGHAVGVAEGPVLVVSKVGSRHVQGRTAAGGWSQQRFARRREGQGQVALQAAADTAVKFLLPEVGRLDGILLGGDRGAVTAVLADRRLAALAPLVGDRLLDVAEPRLVILEKAVAQVRALQVKITDPAGTTEQTSKQ